MTRSKKLQKETLRHKEVFEKYYILGQDRSIAKLSKEVKVSECNLKIWSKQFGWQIRIQERDNKNAIELAKKTDKSILEIKTDYRRRVKESLEALFHASRIPLIIKDNKMTGIDLEITTPREWATVLEIIEKYIKLDLFLLGEPESRGEHIVRPGDWKPISKMSDEEALEEFKGHLAYFKKEFGE